jgi:cytochrome c-type biogenesis protein CcmF
MDPEYRKQMEDSVKYIMYNAKVGDTIFTKSYYAVIQQVGLNPVTKDYHQEQNDIAIGMKLAVRTLENDSAFIAEPIIVLRENEVYNYPAQLGQLQVKVKLPEQIFESVLVDDEKLKYSALKVQRGQEVVYNDLTIKLLDFDKNAKHANYTPVTGDIGVNAVLEITNKKGIKTQVKPLFVIRDGKPFSLKDEAVAMGLHAKFVGINPETGTATIQLAQSEKQEIPVLIAEKVGRSDYIVLQAIEFPGINYFWLGSVLMMFGLAMSMVHRMRKG